MSEHWRPTASQYIKPTSLVEASTYKTVVQAISQGLVEVEDLGSRMPEATIFGTALSEHKIPILLKIPEGEAVNPKVYGTSC